MNNRRVIVKELEDRVLETPYCAIGEIYGKDNPQLVEVNLSDQFLAMISFHWRPSIIIKFAQYINDCYGNKTKAEVVISWKAVPEWLKQSSKYVRGHFEKEVTPENWIDVIMDTASELKQHMEEVVSLCQKSSNIDENGNVKKKYQSWKTKGRIISITKEMPVVYVYHAKKDRQSVWDNSPYFHGSNGTYVENANPYWSLNIKIKRPSYEVPDPIRTNIDIHEYVTKSLMIKLGWERITQNRLNWLNEIISGTEMELETTDTDEAALYRTFTPIGFKTWDDYLNSIILSRINGEDNE